MFDFNDLFKKVYAITDPMFDPSDNFYTVFVNGAGKDSYYTEFENHRRIHMGDSFYREFDLGEIEPESFRTEVMGLDRTFAIKVNTAFVFLYDLTVKPFSAEYLQIVREHMQPNDTVAVIVLLPEDAEKRNALLTELGTQIRENEVLYLYTKMPYRDRYLAEALCGTILMHSSKRHYAEFRKQESIHLPQMLNGALASLPAEGAAAIKAKPPVLWSTLGCAFSNPKMDYLRSYVAAMCEKAQKLTTEDYKNFCRELYKNMVPDMNRDARNVHALLADVVSRVPRVIKTEPKYEGYTLQDYFAQLYGSDGQKTIELSFKVTLSMMPNEMNETVIVNVANTLFERAAQYHSEDLYAEICAFLHDFCEGMTKDSGRIRRIQSAGNDSFREDLDNYINEYIQYYGAQKYTDFWINVENYVLNNKPFFEPFCRKARELYMELVQLKKELQFRKDVYVEDEVVCCYPVADILSACGNAKICGEIAATYKEPARKDMGTETVDMSYLTTLSSPPGFSTEMNYEMITGNGGYTAYVKQTLGKYLHFNQK